MTLRRLPLCADLINKSLSDYSLLDIGCRTMALKPYLKGCTQYFGADLVPGENILQCNLEEGLKFPDKSFDVVVALDVLEHLEHAHLVFADMQRVARKAVVVALPNMFYWKFRLNFLMGKGISGKYAFPTTPILDRHRWVLSYTEATKFIEANANARPVEKVRYVPERGRTKWIIEPLERKLAEIYPDLFAYGGLYYINIDA
jgi:hypothetical protein